MTIILDVLAVAIIVVFAFSAYKKGFLHTAIRLSGTIIAFGVSMIYSKPVASAIYRSYFRERITLLISQNLQTEGETTLETFAELASQFTGQLPSFISEQLTRRLGIQADVWYQAFLTNDSAGFSDLITQNIVSPIVTAILQAVVFCLIFAILMFFVKTLAALMSTVNHVPIIGSINALLGAVLGTVQGVVYLFVLCAMLWLVITATSDSLTYLNFEIIESTKILKHFFTAGPWVDTVIKGL